MNPKACLKTDKHSCSIQWTRPRLVINAVCIKAACLQSSTLGPNASAFLKRLPSHYVLELGYPCCDYSHIRPCKMYSMAHLEGLNDLSDPFKQSAASVRSQIQARQIGFSKCYDRLVESN